MKQRVITAILMAIVFIPFFFLGGWFITFLFSILSYIAMYELITMYQSKKNIPNVCKYIIPLFSSIIVLFSSFATAEDIIYVLLVELMFLLILPIFNKKIEMKDVIFFIFGIIYSGISFAIIVTVRNIEMLYQDASIRLFDGLNIYAVGLILFIFVLLSTMLTDIAAYQFGIKFGKHKLCPSISPKKSIEGSIAGTIAGALGGTLFMVILQFTLSKEYANAIKLFKIDNIYLYALAIFGVALLLSIAGQLGDLIASKIKREYNIKDYGKIFPGHGGVLDRFDSSIYSFLVFIIILMISGVTF
ncbi:MAG: phosphatidate cytidylyltransferase [Bacilli bacterium]|jgi:cytidylyltransferase family|nr:phosphatidate cytidylyltransferase [Bacilli bacterium]